MEEQVLVIFLIDTTTVHKQTQKTQKHLDVVCTRSFGVGASSPGLAKGPGPKSRSCLSHPMSQEVTVAALIQGLLNFFPSLLPRMCWLDDNPAWFTPKTCGIKAMGHTRAEGWMFVLSLQAKLGEVK